MKILLTIHHELDRNAGVAGVTWQLGQEYQKLGHDVQYYSFDNLPHRLPGIAKSVVFPEFAAYHISDLLEKQAVDVVDASTGDAWLWGKMFRGSTQKRPVLMTRCHGLEHVVHLEYLEEAKRGNLRLSWKYPIYHGGFRLWEVANSLRCADLVFLLNHRDLEYAVEKLGVKPEKIRIVPNGISQELLNLTFEPMPESGDSTIGIAQVGTYIPRKGIHYSVPALNEILARYPQVKVSFLGTGCPEALVYADFDPVVRDRILVVPRYTRETLSELLRGHYIKIFPTLSEGFGLALLEAMACGLAPITTATPGPMEIVRDGHDATVIPSRDTQAIKQAVERLLTNRDELERLRRNAYFTAQNYSWMRIARDNLSFYEDVLSPAV